MTDMHTDTPRREKSPLEELASLDAKGMASEEQRDYLRRPENLFAWKAVLSGLRVDMEAQFTAQKARIDKLKEYCFTLPEAEGRALFSQEVREYKRWKGAAARYFASIQLAYQEYKALIHEQSEKEGQRYAALSRALANDLYEFLRDDENLPPES